MAILFEVISVIGTVIWETVKCFFTIVVENLPLFLEMKQILGVFTPAGMIALYLGVPTIVVTAAITLIKKAIRA